MQAAAIRLTVVLLVIALAISVLWLTRTRPPPLASLNGTYQNSCCEQIELKDGILITSELRIPFKLRSMKYGLESAGRTVEARNGRIVISPWPACGRLLFAADRRSFTLASHPCGQAGVVSFKRI